MKGRLYKLKLYIYKDDLNMVLLGIFAENTNQSTQSLIDYCNKHFRIKRDIMRKRDWKNNFELVATRNLKNYEFLNININVFEEFFDDSYTLNFYYSAVPRLKTICINSLNLLIYTNEQDLRLDNFSTVKIDELMIQNDLTKLLKSLKINDIETLNNQIWQFKNKQYYPSTNRKIKNLISYLNTFIETYNHLTTDISNNLLGLVSELQIDQVLKNTRTIDSLTSIASEIRTKNYTDYEFLELLLEKTKLMFDRENLLSNLNLENQIDASIKTTKLINKLTKD